MVRANEEGTGRVCLVVGYHLWVKNRDIGPGIRMGFYSSLEDVEKAKAFVWTLLGLTRGHEFYLEVKESFG